MGFRNRSCYVTTHEAINVCLQSLGRTGTRHRGIPFKRFLPTRAFCVPRPLPRIKARSQSFSVIQSTVGWMQVFYLYRQQQSSHSIVNTNHMQLRTCESAARFELQTIHFITSILSIVTSIASICVTGPALAGWAAMLT